MKTRTAETFEIEQGNQATVFSVTRYTGSELGAIRTFKRAIREPTATIVVLYRVIDGRRCQPLRTFGY